MSSSRSNDLSVHARIDSSGKIRHLWETDDDRNGHAAIFEVKFGKKTEKNNHRIARAITVLWVLVWCLLYFVMYGSGRKNSINRYSREGGGGGANTVLMTRIFPSAIAMHACNSGGRTLGSQTPGVPATHEPSTTNNCWSSRGPPLALDVRVNCSEELQLSRHDSWNTDVAA